jgi:RNA polymerase sigma-70 factor (ECF subfamily)
MIEARMHPLNARGPDRTAPAIGPPETGLDFTTVYRGWFAPVCRWLRSLGGPEADVEDLAQEVFVVVRRKLDSFDGENLPGWLFRIAARTASDARRRAWFRRILRGGEPLDLEAIVDSAEGPEEAMNRAEVERLLYRILDRLGEKRRRALILADIEGLSAVDIGRLESIPASTARARLFLARKEFHERAARVRAGGRP